MPGRIMYFVPSLSGSLFKSIHGAIRSRHLRPVSRWWRGESRPIGGIKVLYQHVEILRELGFDAYVLRESMKRIDWFKHVAPELYLGRASSKPTQQDVVVWPEIIPYKFKEFSAGRNVVFVQNWVGASRDSHFIEPHDRFASYRQIGFDSVICCGQYIAAFLKENGRGDAEVCSNFVDTRVFWPDAKLRVANTIMYLPRKNSNDSSAIIEKVLENFPRARFKAVENVSEIEMAQQFRRSDIFLATGYPEGFGLPSLEAMASGCAVAGFTGGGGKDFMINGETAVVAEDGDVNGAANGLLELLSNASLREHIRRGGQEIVPRYSREALKAQLLDTFHKFSPAACR